MNTQNNNGTTAAQVKSMTKAFVAYTLGTEPTWKPGDSVTFQFLSRNTNSAWEATLTRETDDHAPFIYRLDAKQLTHEGHEPKFPATRGRRYYTMEKAFLHILNHFNENANIRNRYTDVWQWLDEGNRTESWV
jgi:hypothetical protein